MLLKLTEQDWERVAARVQSILSDLDASIIHHDCTIRTIAQRSAGGPNHEFNNIYRSYYCREFPDSEGVVVEININVKDDHYVLEGDIGGEETGYTYFEIPAKTIVGNFKKLLNSAEDIARQLAQQSAILSNAIARHRLAPDVLQNSNRQ